MKRMFAIIIACIMLIALTACGQKTKNENVAGTWKVDFIEYEGSKFTVEEWNIMEDEDLSGFYIVLKEGGKAYLYDGEDEDLVDWLKSGDTIMIDDEKCSIVDGKICCDYYGYYGDKLYLKKVSESQEIPKKKSDDVEWEDFLIEYEDWVDEYIEVVKEYKENPTDASVLFEYTEMTSEMNEWLELAEKMKLEIADEKDVLEYSKELLRISKKISEINN